MEEIAQVYARSLFQVARERDQLDEIRQQLGQFADAVAEERSLQLFFFSPELSSEEKKEGLHRAVADADDTLVNFLELLLEKHRMPAIFRIRRTFDGLWAEEHRLLPVQVTSAIRPAARWSSKAGWTLTSWAASSCAWGTRSSTRRYATAWTN
jgi:ATP synthase F1 delta subunit